jgi:hypothetical protein
VAEGGHHAGEAADLGELVEPLGVEGDGVGDDGLVAADDPLD